MLNLGLSASAAATHEHEASTVQAFAMDQEQLSFLRPLQFLQAQLQAFTTSSTSTSQTTSLPSTSKQENGPVKTDITLEGAFPDKILSSINSERTFISKTKTSYQLAYPPPSPRSQSRFSLRPRLLLQLRKINQGRLAAPVLEVFTLPRSLRTSVKQHALERGQSPAGDNLMVLGCDPYNDTQEPVDTLSKTYDDENFEHRNVVASIHRTSGSDVEQQVEAQICIGQGYWTITKMRNGGYEFIGNAEDGSMVKAKWIPKMRNGRGAVHQHPGHAANRKFKFTLLDPHTRRHPILGSMDRQTINIFDQYIKPETPVSEPEPSPPASISSQTNSSSTLHDNNIVPVSDTIVNTSEHTKTLMLATGIWIALAEGWLEMECSNSTGTSSHSSPNRFRNFTTRTFQSEESNEAPRSPTVTQRPGTLRGFHRHTATTVSLSNGDATSSTSSLARTRSASSAPLHHTLKASKLSLEVYSATQGSKPDLRLPPARPRHPERSTSAAQVPSTIKESPISARHIVVPRSAPEDETPDAEIVQQLAEEEKWREGEDPASRRRSASRESRMSEFLGSTGGSRRKRIGRLLRFMHKKGEDGE